MAKSVREQWSQLIAEQEAGRESIRGFCRRRGVGEHSFYMWRSRLRLDRVGRGVQFALLEAKPASPGSKPEPTPAIELTLKGGECLRIYPGVDATTLRVVLDAVRQ